MKNRALSFLLIASLLYSPIHALTALQDSPTTAQVTANDKQEAQQLDKIREAALKSLEQVLFTLQGVNQDIAAKTISSLSEKQCTEAVNTINTILPILQNLQRDILDAHTPTIMHECLSVFDTIATFALNGIKQPEQLTLKALNAALTRLMPKKSTALIEKTLNDVKKIMHSVSINGKKLAQEANALGISAWNKGYRTFDHYVIQPVQKYKVPHILGAVTAATAISAYAWYYFMTTQAGLKKSASIAETMIGHASECHEGPLAESRILYKGLNTVISHINNSVRSVLGWPVETVGDSGQYLSIRGMSSDVGILGALEHKLTKLTLGHLAIGALLLNTGKTKAVETYNTSKHWISRTVKTAHNKMLGGAYKKAIIRDDFRMQSDKHFKDLVGLEHVKQELQVIVDYIENPERFAQRGIIPPTGILLTGAPGSGKTYSVKALCGEIEDMLVKNKRNKNDVGFFSITNDDIQRVGIDTIMAYFKRHAPCVLFVDELHLLGLQQTGNTHTLGQFLTAMSGFDDQDPKKKVIMIAATNKPEHLDQALLRSGRFGKQIRFDLPSLQHRCAFIADALSQRGFDPNNFDIAAIGVETEGCTYSTITDIIRDAQTQSSEARRLMGQFDIMRSVDRIVRHIVHAQYKELPAEEKLTIATYLAGQTYALITQEMPEQLRRVTLHPITAALKETFVGADLIAGEQKKQQAPIQYGGIFTGHTGDTINVHNTHDLRNQCKLKLAGFVAEKVVLGAPSYNYRKEDKQRAVELAQSIVFEGVDATMLSRKRKDELLDKTQALVAELEQELITEFKNNEPVLHAIIEQLLERNTLSRNDVVIIVKNALA